MDLRFMLVSQVLSLLQGGLYEFMVSLKLVKRRGEQRGKINLLQCIKKYLEVLTQKISINFYQGYHAVWIHRQRGENLRLCCAQLELEKEIRNLRFT